ncbi:MAG: DUF3793 family protein [Desulfuromonadaceae bacterium]|nr:DUF3793 family protein [Desulfuromonadaceae bacterium]
MYSTNDTPLRNISSHRNIADQVLENFTDALDCLTAHLMLESSEVLAGVKPANLISIVNRTRPCGRNLYLLWQQHHTGLAQRLSNLNFMVLQNRPQSLLLLCYDHDQLEQHLSHPGIRALLHKAGYKDDATCEDWLIELRNRIGWNKSFPHEIGLFIGYPAKDVAAFMGLVDIPFACQGPWKIYGNPALSLALAEQYRCCRKRMGAILAMGTSKTLELDRSNHPFFCHTDENDYQYLNYVN